jgi:NitT/TauT family transport system permease protein
MRGAAGLAVPLVLLEIAARGGLVDEAVLPPATVVIGSAVRLLGDAGFLVHVAGTLVAWGLGLAIATMVAVPLGAALGSSRPLRIAGLSVVELLRPIPSVALVPIAILLLGRGLDMKVAVVAYASTWPILLNTITGMREVDPLARETARVYGLGRLATVRLVALPTAAPFAFTGLRISAAIALVVAVSAELIAGGGTGIGTWMLTVSQAGVPRELLYAGILIAGCIGLAINAVLVAADRRLFAWHHARRGTEA